MRSAGEAHTLAGHASGALDVLSGAGPLRTGKLFDHIIVSMVVTVAPDGRTASARSTGVSGEYARWKLGTHENAFSSGTARGRSAIEAVENLNSSYPPDPLRPGL
jgi:hypothetical protein